MDQLHSKNKQRYFTLDFEPLTEKGGLKPLLTAFNRISEVAEVVSSNRAGRKDGMKQKTAQFIFINGQSVTITVSETGDVTQTKLNTVVIPVNAMRTVDAYAKEVCQKMEANQPKFDKALARKAAAAIKDASKVKPASKTLKQQLVEANEALVTANRNIDSERSRLETLKNDKAGADSEIEKLRLQLSALKTEENQIVEAIESLGGTV
ncbi:TPA: hypothetical protein QDZ84_002912 [Shewanella algae]|uniref:defense against restriction DarA-related protein n=1 Tax=Shewanella algae TaxID=38313 RepID=UPI001AAF8DA3|nr:hypothetical protein [Shewanella algae]MBO2580299.1 hypothetical protein [Shewanella algae]HDS1207885.1 hypothetical protein [Shewanella algae]